MSHALLAGATEMGKTSLAKLLAKAMNRVAVFEVEYKTPWPNTVFHTTDINDLLLFAKTNKNCNIFIDDSEEATDRDRQYNFFATRARHFGHRFFFLMQRPVQVLPTIRNNCSAIYLFRINPVDAKQLAIDFNEPMLEDAPNLPSGAFFCKQSPIAKCVRLKVF